MFLQILGVLFLVVIAVVGYFGWKVYRLNRTRQSGDFATALAVLPAIEMELEPSAAQDWKEIERLEYTESELKKVGATHVGYYCVYHGHATIRVSMWNYRNQAVAVIYEGASDADKNSVQFIYEVSCRLTDGTLCVTSNQHALYDSRPARHKLVFKESGSILELLKAARAEIPEGEKIAKIEDPKAYFTECYEDITEWAWKPEQLRSDKTRQMLVSVGVDVTEELVGDLVDMGVSYSVEVNIHRARRKLAQNSKMSVEQWEKIRDKLVFVNECMQVDHLIDAVHELAGELSEVQERAIEGFERNSEDLRDPVGAFQILMQSLQIKAKRVATMSTPVRTEVYLPL